MKKQSHVLIITAITAFVMALIISEDILIPNLVVAGLILIAGIIISSLLTLNHRRFEQAQQLYQLVQNALKLNLHNTSNENKQELVQFVKNLIKAETAFYISIDNNSLWFVSDMDIIKDDIFDFISPVITEGKSNLIIDVSKDERFNKKIIPIIKAKSLLIVPVKISGDIIGYFGGINSVVSFERSNREILDYYSKITANFINVNKELAEEKDYIISLLKATIAGIDNIDHNFARHSERVAEVSYIIAKKLGLTRTELKNVYFCGLLHDIGKIILSNSINDKNEIQEHVVLGVNFIPEGTEWDEIRNGILYHHERYNGTGYPEGLQMTAIPFIARIIAVADLYDALTLLTDEKLEPQVALEHIKKASGTILDPLVVVAFEETFGEIELIYDNYQNTVGEVQE